MKTATSPETDDIKNQLRAFIQENFLMGAGGPPLADADSLIASQVIDSTGFLELVTYVEEAFGIAIEDEEMTPENLDSVAALSKFVLRKLAG